MTYVKLRTGMEGMLQVVVDTDNRRSAVCLELSAEQARLLAVAIEQGARAVERLGAQPMPEIGLTF